jgi:DNA (cytosine-5)-methyltransferase 1
MKKFLDLFCGAGGASTGYARAGFEVIGVDIEPQPHYPYEFHLDDALLVLSLLLRGEKWRGYRLQDFAGIHTSPVCKGYTSCNLSPKERYPRLIGDVRRLLVATGLPYVIENVMGAKRDLDANLKLCGTMFGLRTPRHRLFEIGGTDIFWMPPRPCNHKGATIAIYGHSVWDSSQTGTPRRDGRSRPDSVAVAIGRAAMDISWMTQVELAQAIPPAYTRWIGEQLLSVVEVRA